MEDFVAGVLDERRRKNIRSHLERCGSCRSEEQDLRLVTQSLRAWPDEEPPSDGLHRLEGRLAFLPPPPERAPAGRLRTLVLPYVAGMATAAAILLLVGPVMYDSPGPVAPPLNQAPVADSGEPAVDLFEGERVLQPVNYAVDEQGNLHKVPPEDLLRGMTESEREFWEIVTRQAHALYKNQDH
jgi:hypothetical protein